MNDKVRDLISQEAADWFVANREVLSPTERQAFVAWLKNSPLHVEEYLAHSVIVRDLRGACEYSDQVIDDLIARARTHPDPIAPSAWSRRINRITRSGVTGWRPAGLVAAMCAAVGAGWFALRESWPISVSVPPAAIVKIDMATRHGEQRSRLLPDGSALHLNTDSDVSIRYTAKERLVILNRGEVDFEVNPDSARTFRVVAGAAQVTDIGTIFDVQVRHDRTVVTVVEGGVGVSPSTSSGRGEVSVYGGQQVTVVDGVWPPAKPIVVDANHATAWLHRQIVFDHTSLGKVAAEFNRYAIKPIEILTPDLQELQISGIFTIDDPAAFIAFLRSLDSVRVEETATQVRVSRRSK